MYKRAQYPVYIDSGQTMSANGFKKSLSWAATHPYIKLGIEENTYVILQSFRNKLVFDFFKSIQI